jgi:Methane oxygenase PmoA
MRGDGDWGGDVRRLHRRVGDSHDLPGLLVGLVLALASPSAQAQVDLPGARPVPRMQSIPLPDDRASLRRDGVELAAYEFGPGLRRPFLFPIVGPSGRSLTRIGHPHDPVSHSHHTSVWVGHFDVGGEDFWGDRNPARVVHRRVLRYDDGDDAAGLVALNDWVGAGGRVLMQERRGVSARPLDGGDWLLVLDLQFEAAENPVTLGATPFGPVGVRVAKSMGVLDGGGRIRNSEGDEGEQGPRGAFRKHARWVDYSGPIAPGVAEGLTLLDHPSNPRHPPAFHVRADGWMGASPTLDGAIEIRPGAPLRLRYGLFVHGGVPEAEMIERRWRDFAAMKIP